MSINRDMETYMLQYNEMVRSESGAEKENWVGKGVIQAAVYKKGERKMFSSEKYIESTHTGLTYCREIDSDGYRLMKNETAYEIIDCNTEGRLTNLLLKVVK